MKESPQPGSSSKDTAKRTTDEQGSAFEKKWFEAKNGKSFVVEQITSEQILKDKLIKERLRYAYRAAYEREPYYGLAIENHDIDSLFKDHTKSGNVFVATDGSRSNIIAFTAIRPFSKLRTSTANYLSEAQVVDENSWYLYDLGTRKQDESNGIGTALMQTAIDSVPPNSPIILKTMINNQRAIKIYSRFGFKIDPNIPYPENWTYDQTFMVLDPRKSPNHARDNARPS